MDITQIMATIQHRYPFLLVDRIEEMTPAERIVGIKNITVNEPYSRGYFPGDPQVPGVLILEHAAQLGCVLLLSSADNANKLGLFTGVENVQFHRPIRPGDQVRTEVTMLHLSRRAGKVHFTSRVDDTTVADGQFTFLLIPDPAKA